MTTPQEDIDLIDRLIEDAKRDLRFKNYEARETIKRLQRQRMEANNRLVESLNKPAI